jgi:SNF2 family DNA or RNA helicase
VKAIRKKYESFAVVEAFYGGTKDQERTNIIERFKDPKSNLQYLVANPKTGGYGLNLVVSDTIIYYSNNYDLEVRVQSEDRIHRMGQNNKCTYIDLQCAGTVDEHIITNLISKTKISHKVLNEQYKDWIKQLKKSYK